jgi:predicted O-methyltransferase YrrM
MASEYDFIYIDGDHSAAAVVGDAIGAYRLLKTGGLLAFDDYLWRPSNGGGEALAPAVAIDTFLGGYGHSIQVIEKGLQVWVRKIA